MKITKRQLKRIINEEISCLVESSQSGGDSSGRAATRDAAYQWDSSGRKGAAAKAERKVAKREIAQEVDLDFSKIFNVDIGGIDMSDYPDFSDAFVESGEYEHSPGEYRELTTDELDYLNSSEETDWVYQQVWDQVH